MTNTCRTSRHGDLQLLGMGNGWMVVDKPWGMSVHNAPGHDLCSQMVKGLTTDPALGERIHWDRKFGIHPVHRLDRATSGVILLAGHRHALVDLAKQFESGTVTKRYHALVHGRLEAPETPGGWGFWDHPLSKAAGGRKNPAGHSPRMPCRTRYRIIAHSSHYTWIACEPLTGRTHQIRRHAKLAGHPVVGDGRYGSPRSVAFLKDRQNFTRLGLHAAAISFTPPGEKQPILVGTKTLPQEMTVLLEEDDPHEEG